MTDLQDLLWAIDLDRFWSAAVAWNLTEEDFLADSDIVNSLKLRASLGETGNNNVGLNSYQSLFGYGGSYDDNGAVSPGHHLVTLY